MCPNNLLVDAKHRAAFASVLVEALRGERGWHELVLDRFVADDARVLARDAPSLELEELTCRVMDLRSAEDNDGSVMAALKSRTRSKIRRSLRASAPSKRSGRRPAAKRSRSWTISSSSTSDAGGGSGTGRIRSPRVVAFHRDLVPKLLARDAVVLFRVRAAAAPWAAATRSSRAVGCSATSLGSRPTRTTGSARDRNPRRLHAGGVRARRV